MPQWEITVYGRVQGVGFRYFVKQTAQKWNVEGFVKNLYDGSVYVLAVAYTQVLESFCQELERGNTFSRVRDIQIYKEETTKRYHGFEIR
ncbi:MAG: acylphosphatase [Candidatus Cloacimonadaceae bacterium]